MLLPTEHMSTASIVDVEPNHLLLAVDREGALIWVVRSGDDNYAVFLTGEYAERGFKIAPQAGGSGLVVGPVQTRIDPTSLSTEGGQWRLRARDNALAVHFGADEGGFHQGQWARVAEMKTLPDEPFYFSRWSIGIEVDMEWTELVSVSDGQIQTELTAVAKG